MLTLHRAERSDTLADALADVLRVPLADPMATEVISVPARGVERWLTQHLATTLGAGAGGTDGIAANIDFSSPAALSEAVVDAVRTTPRSHAGPYGRHDPWEPARMVWQVLAVLDENIDDPALDIIARHIGSGRAATGGSGRAATGADNDLRVGRRFATARHLADLFDRYGRQRPAMLVEWATGHDTDGTGTELASDMVWQARFWRAVHARIGVDHPALTRLSPLAAGLVVVGLLALTAPVIASWVTDSEAAERPSAAITSTTKFEKLFARPSVFSDKA